jgi:hypothetical protein
MKRWSVIRSDQAATHERTTTLKATLTPEAPVFTLEIDGKTDERGDAALRRAHAAEILLDEVRAHFTRDDDLPNGLLQRIDQHLKA